MIIFALAACHVVVSRVQYQASYTLVRRGLSEARCGCPTGMNYCTNADFYSDSFMSELLHTPYCQAAHTPTACSITAVPTSSVCSSSITSAFGNRNGASSLGGSTARAAAQSSRKRRFRRGWGGTMRCAALSYCEKGSLLHQQDKHQSTLQRKTAWRIILVPHDLRLILLRQN